MTSKNEWAEYIDRRIIKETDKAYLVEQVVANRRDGWHTNFKWVPKGICKPSECGSGEYVAVPTWKVGNGVW